MAEELRYTITGDSRSAQKANKDLAATTDLAARGARLLKESIEKQNRAVRESVGATLTLAKTEQLLKDSTDEAIAGFVEERVALERDKRAKEEAAAANLGLAASGDAASSSIGGMSPVLAGVAGAATALAPAVVTLGFGLAGLGAAAYGTLSPIEKAAQKAGGLRANLDTLDPLQQKLAREVLTLGGAYKSFQDALAPQVVSVFNTGLRIAAGLMADVEPVAKATGDALGVLLGRVDQEFRSGTWRNFFTFMARTAAPDLRLLGDSLINVVDTIPPLLRLLQPLTTDLLGLVDVSTKLVDVTAHVSAAVGSFATTSTRTGGALGGLIKAFKISVVAVFPMVGIVGKLQGTFNKLANSSEAAAEAMGKWNIATDTGAAAAGLATAGVTAMNEALQANIDQVLTSQGAIIGWRQSLLAATKQLASNSAGLRGNSANALANKQAVLSATQAAIGFADNQIKVHGDLQQATAVIRDQIGWLEKHGGKSKFAAQEIGALRGELRKLQNVGPIHENIFMTGKGTWGIFGRNPVNSGLFNAPGRAAGWLVPGHGTGDTVPAMLTPGETVVPRQLTPAVAPLMKAHGVPGFAQGGIVPGYHGAIGGLRQWTAHNWNASLGIISNSMAAAIARAFAHAVSTAVGALGGPTSASAAQAQAYAQSRLRFYGWGLAQMAPLIALWNQESGWNRFARNPTSGAYGIPQALPPSKMGALANPPVSSAAAQINWGLGYIRSVYGSPAAAEAHERAFNWYDRGGFLPKGLSLAYNGTGYPEMVTPARSVSRPQIVFQLPSTANAFDQFMLSWLQGAVRTHGGGDTQSAFGTSY